MKKIILIVCFCFFATVNGQCWKSISAGAYFTTAVKTDGTLWSWGANNLGQLGDGTTIDKNVPTKIGLDSDWASVSTSFLHTLAIKNNGTLWSWGRNDSFVLGYVDLPFSSNIYTSPTQVGTDTNWKLAATGYVHSLALKTDNTLWAWGRVEFAGLNAPLQGAPIQISSAPVWSNISVGVTHTLVLKNDGTLWAAGSYVFGQLGLGTTVNTSSTNSLTQVGTATNWNSISAGQYSSSATRNDGTLWSWGLNNYGQLGDGSTINKIVPTQVGTDNNWLKVLPVACNENDTKNSFAIKNDNTLWGWGNNSYGRLGLGTTTFVTTPTQIGVDNDWAFLTGGDYHSLALKTNNNLYGFGYNFQGQIGNGTNVNSSIPVAISCSNTLVIDTFNSPTTTTSIYPNPNNGKFSINSNNEKVTQVSLFSLDGKLINTQKPNTLNPEIALPEISKGMYLVNITLESGAESKSKIIIE